MSDSLGTVCEVSANIYKMTIAYPTRRSNLSLISVGSWALAAADRRSMQLKNIPVRNFFFMAFPRNEKFLSVSA